MSDEVNGEIFPILLPPEHVRSLGDHWSWNDHGAQTHFDWFMVVRRQRIEGLLGFFHVSSPAVGEEFEFLRRLGEEVARKLRSEPNWKEIEGKKALTAPGLAMAYDMGVFVAELIVASSKGTVTWKILKKPGRQLGLNLPVLSGRPTMTFEPIGGSLTEAKAILRGAESSDVWARIYRLWLDRLMSDVVLPVRKRTIVTPEDDVER